VKRRTPAVGVLGMGAVLTLAGCSAEPGSQDAPTSAKSTSAAPTSPAPSRTEVALPAGWHRVESPAIGLSVGLPRGWVGIDVTSGHFARTLTAEGIAAGTARRLENDLAALRGTNLLYAIEKASIDSGYVNNVNAVCAPSGGASPAQLKNSTKVGLTRIGARNVRVTDLVIAGTPAVRAAYRLRSPEGMAEVVQFRLPGAGGKLCAVTVGTRQGKMLRYVDRIGSTIRSLETNA
jgi:hypothetical protein